MVAEIFPHFDGNEIPTFGKDNLWFLYSEKNNFNMNISELKYSIPFQIEEGGINVDKFTIEIMSLRDFVRQLLLSIYFDIDISFAILDCSRKETQIKFPDIILTHRYLIIIECLLPLNKLKRLFKKEISDLNPSNGINSVFWFDGEELNDLNFNNQETDQNYPICNTLDSNTFKNHIILPKWLDSFLFNDLKGLYEPDYKRFEFNLDLSKDEVKTYLGTYFPRSYAESYCIFENLFNNQNYYSTIKDKTQITILDFGAGTGGEIIGLLEIFEKYLPNLNEVKILAIDGNHRALRYSTVIVEQFRKHCSFSIKYNVGPVEVYDDNDLIDIENIISGKYDFIISFKAICELISKNILKTNAYKYVAEKFANKLTDIGIMLILDVTIENSSINTYYPIYLNNGIREFIKNSNEFQSLLPLSCNLYEDKCNLQCFSQRIFKITHSRRTNDISKVAYRVIARRNLVKLINPKRKGSKLIIQEKSGKNIYCPFSEGKTILNAFNLNN